MMDNPIVMGPPKKTRLVNVYVRGKGDVEIHIDGNDVFIEACLDVEAPPSLSDGHEKRLNRRNSGNVG
jgi:hypothetical protein